MRVRHRIPSIFNLSMVDVLCCALGCVILLWLLNLREAKDHQDNASRLFAAATQDRDEAYRQVRSLDEERARLRGELAQERVRLTDLEARLRTSAARAAALDSDLRAARGRHDALAARAAEQEDKLRLADARMRDLQASADQVAGLQRDLRAARTK
jgi:chromosome segregation ATPase